MDMVWSILSSIITCLLGIIIGWYLTKKLSDRSYLRSEIYPHLYEEVKMMHQNISELKNCYVRRYGRPDHSAPFPPDKVPGNVRKYLMLTQKYMRIPQNLRTKLNCYYSKCEEWNSELDIRDLIRGLNEGKIKDIQVTDEGRRCTIQYSSGRKEEKWSLVGARDYEKYEDIKEIDEKELTGNIEKKQRELGNLGIALLAGLEDRIGEPSRLSKLGRLK